MKYVRVWIKRRRNPPDRRGRVRLSLTLQWRQDGRDRYRSLGPWATEEYTEMRRAELEQHLNGPAPAPRPPGAGWPRVPSQFAALLMIERPAVYDRITDEIVARGTDRPGPVHVAQYVGPYLTKYPPEDVLAALEAKFGSG
jgi:hypothetical protein